MILGICTALVVILVDQLSKYWILSHVLENDYIIRLTPFFNIVKAWNTGASFSMFSDKGALGAIVLCVVALAIVAALLWWLKGEKNRLSQLALGMIIGGAIGNVIDRVRIGAVFDFLDVYWGSHHWPAFNAADSFICIGAVILIIQSIVIEIKKEKK